MNRRYTNAHYRTLIEKLRQAMPECGITTDLIAGFPGETQVDHRLSLALVRDMRFDAAFTFAFSPRKGTPAAAMEGQVDEDTKR